MSRYKELAEALDITAKEIADRGINGWGNACSGAAAALRELDAENEGLADRIDTLEVERNRLREALEALASGRYDDPRDVRDIARAALEQSHD